MDTQKLSETQHVIEMGASPYSTSPVSITPDPSMSQQYAYSTTLRRPAPSTDINLPTLTHKLLPYSRESESGPRPPTPVTYPPRPSAAGPATPSALFSIQSVDHCLGALGTDLHRGLSNSRISAIREVSGANEFSVAAKDPLWKKFLGQFTDNPLMFLLLGSVGVSFVVGNYEDAASILIAVLIVIAVGFVQEQRSEKSLEALNKLVPHYCHLIRDGETTNQLANVLVPGDLITFRTGDRIPADLRLTVANNLEIDESALTGETVPARKTDAAIVAGPNIPINERKNIAFMGTLVRSGRGEGIVVGTGLNSEFGVIFSMMQDVEDKKTPLQLSMDELAGKLSIFSFAVIGVICLIGVFQKRSWLEMFTIGVSLAVAAIPEGLPIVVTVTLALGVLRMSNRKAIVKKLPSVETLGSISVICSDKTGTLTTNVMTVTKMYTVGTGLVDVNNSTSLDPLDARYKMLLAGNVCNHSYRDRHGKYTGQATEVALMNVLASYKMRDEREFFQRVSDVPFHSDHKWQSCTGRIAPDTAYATNLPADRDVTFVLGALDAVLPRCRTFLETRQGSSATPVLDATTAKSVHDSAHQLSNAGFRVLSMALGPDSPDALTFLGYVCIVDPPRKGVAEAIARLHSGGVQTVMITGDAPGTALAIAQQVGIRLGPTASACLTGQDLDNLSQAQLEERIGAVTVFARTTPKHKMRIVEALQARGHVVAMTGDGVNDAPALKMADIGIAMGRGGTDVAKEAADVILVDDNFATILPAVEEGKGIFVNIQNFLCFQLSTAVAALSLISFSTTVGLPNPLNAMQILFINIIMDGPPSQSLGVDPVPADVMKRPPRSKKAPILTKKLVCRVLFSSGIIIAGVLYVITQEFHDGTVTARDQTMTFMTFVLLDLISAIQNRGLSVPLCTGNYNRMLLLTVTCSYLVQLSLVYIPFLQKVFQTEALSLHDFGLIWVLGAVSFALHEGRRYIERRRSEDSYWAARQMV